MKFDGGLTNKCSTLTLEIDKLDIIEREFHGSLKISRRLECTNEKVIMKNTIHTF